MWVLYALASALFAGAVSVILKYGLKSTNPDVTLALRTVVILGFAWLMAVFTGQIGELDSIKPLPLVFILLSGVATGLSWMTYFRALKLGDINKVAPVDKLSTPLTILGALVFLGESWQGTLMVIVRIASILMITGGMLLMLDKKDISGKSEDKETGVKAGAKRHGWLFYALASAVFAAASTLLSKAGLGGMGSDLALALRTGVVLIMAWIIVLSRGLVGEIPKIKPKALFFVLFSGVVTGLSWLCYFRALELGDAGLVQPIDKLSILVSVAFAYFVFKEKLKMKSTLGLILLTAGILLPVIVH